MYFHSILHNVFSFIITITYKHAHATCIYQNSHSCVHNTHFKTQVKMYSQPIRDNDTVILSRQKMERKRVVLFEKISGIWDHAITHFYPTFLPTNFKYICYSKWGAVKEKWSYSLTKQIIMFKIFTFDFIKKPIQQYLSLNRPFRSLPFSSCFVS